MKKPADQAGSAGALGRIIPIQLLLYAGVVQFPMPENRLYLNFFLHAFSPFQIPIFLFITVTFLCHQSQGYFSRSRIFTFVSSLTITFIFLS